MRKAGRLYLICLGAAAALCIAAAVLWGVRDTVAPPEPAPGPKYILRDDGGHLALFEPGGGAAVAEYDVYTRLLPEEDVLALQTGVEIYSDIELQKRLEDYGW